MDSIKKSMINLGVSYEIVSDLEKFCKCAENGTFTHIFTTPALYAGVKEKYPDIKPKAKIALMSDFGETMAFPGISNTTAPIFCIPVANFLNGVAEKRINTFESLEKVTFAAPDATVLIVDDLKTNLIVTEGLLKPYGMQVDSCKSGAEAIVAVDSKQYDLVLMDHFMPAMDGIEATARIRALGRNGEMYYQSLPIVAMTANAVTGMREMYLDNKFSDFISKPIDTIALDSIIEKWIPESKKNRLPEASSLEQSIQTKTGLLLDVKGLDVPKGITLTGGTYEKYRKVIRTFHEEGLEKIEEIKRCLEVNDLNQFTTYIHALKNGCWIAGAESLSKAAGLLESASSRNDSKYISENAVIFLSDFELLLNDICKALTGENYDEKKEQVDIYALRRYLEDYKNALSELNIRKLRKITSELQEIKYDNVIDLAVREILRKRLNGDYDEALSLTNSLLDELSNRP